MKFPSLRRPDLWLLLAFIIATAAIYWPGLSGGFLFDDYPNIVDNHGMQPKHADVAALVNAALSSPASEFKRPLASLSFALNYLATGLDPYWMKMTNLVIHLLNGLMVFFLAKSLVGFVTLRPAAVKASRDIKNRIALVAVLIAAGWMLLPINLTGVLYVVQRMESMANLFVLMGLLGYVEGRRRMLATYTDIDTSKERNRRAFRGLALCVASLVLATAVGALAKETAVMLPMYAFLVEWLLFGFQQHAHPETEQAGATSERAALLSAGRPDRSIVVLFVFFLAIPMLLGLAWLLPGLLKPGVWASRDFTLSTRLLSEARIVSDYVVWSLMPTPGALSFYHDNFVISTGLLTPLTTLIGLVFLASLIVLVFWLRRRQRLVALGIALFFACQLLTGTILPLELVYEHRNYFASFGLLLAVIPLLASPAPCLEKNMPNERARPDVLSRGLPMPLARHVLLAGLLVSWAMLTAITARAWGNPLRLAEDLASRAPDSPRAQYELGRTYIIFSHYDPASPFTHLAYAPLEKSAALPNSSILPEQALIFMNSRMHLPLDEAWWSSMVTKLKRHKPGVQDESSLAALTDCMHRGDCKLPNSRMTEAYVAALSHPHPSPRLLAMYGDYAWNILDDHRLGEDMLQAATQGDPLEPAYLITWIRMLSAQGETAKARMALAQLQSLNIGGRLNDNVTELRKLSAPQ